MDDTPSKPILNPHHFQPKPEQETGDVIQLTQNEEKVAGRHMKVDGKPFPAKTSHHILLRDHADQINIHTDQIKELQIAVVTLNKVLHLFRKEGLDVLEQSLLSLESKTHDLEKKQLEFEKDFEKSPLQKVFNDYGLVQKVFSDYGLDLPKIV